MVILFHYPSNYVTAYSKTKIHNAYFFCLFLQFFSFQHFLIRPEKNKNPKQNTHKNPKVTFYSFWIACLSLPPQKSPYILLHFTGILNAVICTNSQWSLKIEIIHLLDTATKLLSFSQPYILSFSFLQSPLD